MTTNSQTPSVEALLEYAQSQGQLAGEEIDFDDHGQIQRVHVSRLLPDPGNARQTMASIKEMADSIQARGQVLNALKIAKSNKEGVAIVHRGNRRLLGKLLQLWRQEQEGKQDEQDWTLPALALAPNDDFEIALDDMVDNLEREEIPPIEEAQWYKDKMDARGLSTSELAARLGGTADEQRIKARLCLLNLATLAADGFEVLEHYLIGRIPLTDAQQIGRMPRDKQRLVAVRVVKRELTGDELAREISRLLGTAKQGNRISGVQETTPPVSGHGITSLGGFGARNGSGAHGELDSYEPRERTFKLAAGTPNETDVSVRQKDVGSVTITLASQAHLDDEMVGKILGAVGKQLTKSPVATG